MENCSRTGQTLSIALRKISRRILWIWKHANHRKLPFGQWLKVPELFGGSADLTGSNNTRWGEANDDQYLSFGVREFGMTAVSNGMQLHGGYRPFTGTFLIFMEYARNAVRLAALMQLPNIFVYTHDSVAVGEDGPTHQPVEQLTNLRTTPNLATWRPCDTVETAVAWKSAMASRTMPTALVLTRQKVSAQARSEVAFANVKRGGYVLYEPDQLPQVLLIATGSKCPLHGGGGILVGPRNCCTCSVHALCRGF